MNKQISSTGAVILSLLTAGTHASNDPIALTATYVTPAGDPVGTPKDTGDGQNEFTFDTTADGKLTITLKATINIEGELSQVLKDKLKFTIDSIGNSELKWDPANTGGKPSFNGKEATAKVTFTGLPENNTDFGKKNTSLLCDNQEIVKEDFEVFYSGTANNHKDQANPTYPNWFVYYKQNEGGSGYKYIPGGHRSGSVSSGGIASVAIGDEAYAGDSYIKTQIVGGQLQATGWSGINKYYANFIGILAHETQHATKETIRDDSDSLSNQFEFNTSNTDPTKPYSARGVLTGAIFTDAEVYAGGPVEENALKGADTSQDWANPGTNHK